MGLSINSFFKLASDDVSSIGLRFACVRLQMEYESSSPSLLGFSDCWVEVTFSFKLTTFETWVSSPLYLFSLRPLSCYLSSLFTVNSSVLFSAVSGMLLVRSGEFKNEDPSWSVWSTFRLLWAFCIGTVERSLSSFSSRLHCMISMFSESGDDY